MLVIQSCLSTLTPRSLRAMHRCAWTTGVQNYVPPRTTRHLWQCKSSSSWAALEASQPAQLAACRFRTAPRPLTLCAMAGCNTSPTPPSAMLLPLSVLYVHGNPALQLQVEAVAEAPKTLTLDTRDLTLHKVTLLSGTAPAAEEGAAPAEQSLQYALADKHPVGCGWHSGMTSRFVAHCSCFTTHTKWPGASRLRMKPHHTTKHVTNCTAGLLSPVIVSCGLPTHIVLCHVLCYAVLCRLLCFGFCCSEPWQCVAHHPAPRGDRRLQGGPAASVSSVVQQGCVARVRCVCEQCVNCEHVASPVAVTTSAMV